MFTVSNRGDVDLSLYPLPFEVSLPTYLFFLVTLAVGYIWGIFSNSVSTFRHKRVAKKEHSKVEALEQEVASLRAQKATTTAPTDVPKITQDD